MNDEPRRGFFGRMIRWLLVVAIAAGSGYATGYYLNYNQLQEAQRRATEQEAEMERRVADVRAEMSGKVADLERQILEAQKTGLERALARAKLMAGLDELLESLTAASAEVEQRNFGRALRRVDRVRQILDTATVAPAVREEISGRLSEIRGRLEQLDPTVSERLTALAQDLERGLVSERTEPPPPTPETPLPKPPGS